MSNKEAIRQKYIYRFCLLKNPSFEICIALLNAERIELETGVDPIININYDKSIRVL